jgi:hypothetical protein
MLVSSRSSSRALAAQVDSPPDRFATAFENADAGAG